jgi:hypothetical protein
MDIQIAQNIVNLSKPHIETLKKNKVDFDNRIATLYLDKKKYEDFFVTVSNKLKETNESIATIKNQSAENEKILTKFTTALITNTIFVNTHSVAVHQYNINSPAPPYNDDDKEKSLIEASNVVSDNNVNDNKVNDNKVNDNKVNDNKVIASDFSNFCDLKQIQIEQEYDEIHGNLINDSNGKNVNTIKHQIKSSSSSSSKEEYYENTLQIKYNFENPEKTYVIFKTINKSASTICTFTEFIKVHACNSFIRDQCNRGKSCKLIHFCTHCLKMTSGKTSKINRCSCVSESARCRKAMFCEDIEHCTDYHTPRERFMFSLHGEIEYDMVNKIDKCKKQFVHNKKECVYYHKNNSFNSADNDRMCKTCLGNHVINYKDECKFFPGSYDDFSSNIFNSVKYLNNLYARKLI